MKFGNINLQGIGEIQNANIQNLASAPTTNLKKGRVYFDTTDNTLYVYDGTRWLDALAQGTTYAEGTGIDITNAIISIDDTVVATKTFVDSAYVPQTTEINGQPLSGDVTLDADDVGAVPTTRKVNNKALSADITLSNTDVGALADTTKYGASLSLNLNTSTYVLTATLKDQDGNTLGTAQTVDLPIESLVLSVDFDEDTNELVITLQSGSVTRVPIGAIIGGLQSEITSTNKLDADLVDDSTSTNKFVTSAQKTQISTNATNIGTIQTTLSGYGNIVTHNVNEFATAAQGTLADSAMQQYYENNSALTVSGGVCTWAVTHNLNNSNPAIHLYEIATGEEVMFDRAITSANVVTIKILASANIVADTYKVVVIG